jgi:hypothetical protein
VAGVSGSPSVHLCGEIDAVANQAHGESARKSSDELTTEI